MIQVFVPIEVYKELITLAQFKNVGGYFYLTPIHNSFFEELNKSKPVLDALASLAKEREKKDLQEQIEKAYDKHKYLVEKLKEFE